MGFLATAVVAALSFGVFYLLDKGFSRVFRNRPQHKSGRSVHLSKGYALAGLLFSVLSILGLVAVCTEAGQNTLLLIAAVTLLLAGIFLLVYYLSFGVYYDGNGFLYSVFGKKSKEYRYSQIVSQQLYEIRGGICINLLLSDGRELALYANMQGVYPFLDTAYLGYCQQKGIDPETAPFHNPDNSLWFPTGQEGI